MPPRSSTQAIFVDTAEGTAINNRQDREPGMPFAANQFADMLRPKMTARTQPDTLYNCHGLTFASRRTWISDDHSILTILFEDRYKPVDVREVLPGDICVYYSEDGRGIDHSGIVVAPGETFVPVPTVCSKWGSFGEVIHLANACTGEYAISNIKYYRIGEKWTSPPPLPQF